MTSKKLWHMEKMAMLRAKSTLEAHRLTPMEHTDEDRHNDGGMSQGIMRWPLQEAVGQVTP